MQVENYFYEQSKIREFPKRFKKMPEDLPDSLKFAHLNPKVAAYLASKEKLRQEEDLMGDGLGKRSLMPEISQAFSVIKNRLDSSLSNDEDSQRYLYEEARHSSGTVLYQLSRIIYYYENISSHIPKTLETQLMSTYTDLTSDVQFVPREWQTLAMKEAHLKRISEQAPSDDEQDKTYSHYEDGRSSRSQSVLSEAKSAKKRILSKGSGALPEIVEDGENLSENKHRGNESRASLASRRTKSDRGKSVMQKGPGSNAGRSPLQKRIAHDFMTPLTEMMSESRSTSVPAILNYVSTIQFQLSSKACEDKGWIVQKGKEDQLPPEAYLEWCIQILKEQLKIIKEQQDHEASMGLIAPASVRYYGDTRRETLLKYRKSPVRNSPVSWSLKSVKPKIPGMYDEMNEDRQIMMATHIDGSSIVYYPSGLPAIISSSAGFGRSGVYTFVYDDNYDNQMLACFTPSGKGVCYHDNGNIRFLSTLKGGHLANKTGGVIRRWKWPQSQVKLVTPVQFQINNHINFRCVGQFYIVLLFSSQKESARFFVNPSEPMKETKHTENDQLLTAYPFTSRAAKELLRLFAPKTKTRTKKKKEKIPKPLADIIKSVDQQDREMYELEAERELAKLQRKAKNLIDDWLEHYRATIGLHSPTLVRLNDSPRRSRSGAVSATYTDRRSERVKDLGLISPTPEVFTARVPSAPLYASKPNRPQMLIEETKESTKRSTSPVVKFDSKVENINPEEVAMDSDEIKLTAAISEKLTQLTEQIPRERSAGSQTRISRQITSISLPEKDALTNNLNLCPTAIKTHILTNDKPQCRCSRHAIPFISDVEFETYINQYSPKKQLQIIIIASASQPETSYPEEMLSQLFQNQNKNRTRPCVQSRADALRIFKYDLDTAVEGSDHTQPLLRIRHNVAPGMCLIYADGKLLFCDHIFNGYGSTRKDFRKQLFQTRLDYTRGFSLPSDFRFSPSQGQSGLRSAWGGEIGGAGVSSIDKRGIDLSRTLTDLDNTGSREEHDHVARAVHESLNQIFRISTESSQIPELPSLLQHTNKEQQNGTGKSYQSESFRYSLPPRRFNSRSKNVKPFPPRLTQSQSTLSFNIRNDNLTFAR